MKDIIQMNIENNIEKNINWKINKDINKDIKNIDSNTKFRKNLKEMNMKEMMRWRIRK